MTGKRRQSLIFFLILLPLLLFCIQVRSVLFSHLKVSTEEKAKVCNKKYFQRVERKTGVSIVWQASDSPARPYRGDITSLRLWTEMF